MISVGVLVDLKWCREAGGQVKVWERFAQAALAFPKEVDLTVHFLGDREGTCPLTENVRYITHPPLLSTERLRFLGQIPEHTDLAPWYPRLLPYLSRYQVIHTTDAFFAFAKTALAFTKRSRVPLVTSIHTDNPRYTRLYTQAVIRRLFKEGRWARFLLNRFRFDERCYASTLRRLDRYLDRCDWILVSNREDWERVSRVLPEKRVSFLRRGIDKEVFHPRWRDRARLEAAFGIPPDRFLLLFVGRVDQGKKVMTFAEAVRLLLERGEPVHGLIVGEGGQKAAVQALLGPHATLPGVIPPSTLAWLYASADLFVFPSEIEVCPNVVIEAKASGLPVLVSAKGGAAQCLKRPGVDGVIVEENSPVLWAETMAFLRRNPALRTQMGQAARRHIEVEWPSWEEVFAQDLLPVWQTVARKGRSFADPPAWASPGGKG